MNTEFTGPAMVKIEALERDLERARKEKKQLSGRMQEMDAVMKKAKVQAMTFKTKYECAVSELVRVSEQSDQAIEREGEALKEQKRLRETIAFMQQQSDRAKQTESELSRRVKELEHTTSDLEAAAESEKENAGRYHREAQKAREELAQSKANATMYKEKLTTLVSLVQEQEVH